MSFRVSPRLTKQGQALLMEALNGGTINMAGGEIELGSTLQQGVAAWTVTGCLSPVVSVPVESAVWREVKLRSVGIETENDDELIKVLRVRAFIHVGLRPEDFLLSELALKVPNPNYLKMDKDGVIDATEKICFAYTNGADDPEVYRMRGNSLTEEIIDIYFAISDDANIQITIDESGLRATIWDVAEMIEEHNVKPGRHAVDFQNALQTANENATAQINTHNTSTNAHENRFTQVGTAISNAIATAQQYAQQAASDALGAANQYTNQKVSIHSADPNAHDIPAQIAAAVEDVPHIGSGVLTTSGYGWLLHQVFGREKGSGGMVYGIGEAIANIGSGSHSVTLYPAMSPSQIFSRMAATASRITNNGVGSQEHQVVTTDGNWPSITIITTGSAENRYSITWGALTSV